jgi:hypothetical protein
MVLDMLHLDSSYVVIRDGMRGTGRNYTPLSLHDVDAFEVAGRIFECQLEPSRDAFISHNLLITSYINLLLRPRYHRLLLTTADTVYAYCADSFSIALSLIDPRSASDWSLVVDDETLARGYVEDVHLNFWQLEGSL